MRSLRRLLICFSTLVIIAALILAAGCSSTSTTTSTSTTSSGPATLSSVSIDPTSPDAAKIGATQSFKAMAKYSDGTTKDVTADATWASSDQKVATIDAKGTATAVAGGNTAITATFSDATGTVLFGVIGVPAPAGGMPGGAPGGAAPGGAPPSGGMPGGAPPSGGMPTDILPPPTATITPTASP
jgi:hypothetical protein